MTYLANDQRYARDIYNRSGNSGLLLPQVSLGLWHNFGHVDDFATGRETILTAFDNGIIHFDLANNYGPPPGSAEENFGKILRRDLRPYRDELIISTKAGYRMWDGPYGEWGSRKYLLASLDQSLRRMGLEYVDIFYSHRFDPDTPLEETMTALADAVRTGKALYVGISNYDADTTRRAAEILDSLGVPCVIHQARYSMLDRWVEKGLLDTLEEKGIGCIAFSPLAQGLLTNKYLKEIPPDSRAASPYGFLQRSAITPRLVDNLRKLDALARERGQSLAQMALAWVLKDPRVTSVLVGARNKDQLLDSFRCIENTDFSTEELELIDRILAGN